MLGGWESSPSQSNWARTAISNGQNRQTTPPRRLPQQLDGCFGWERGLAGLEASQRAGSLAKGCRNKHIRSSTQAPLKIQRREVDVFQMTFVVTGNKICIDG